MKRIKLILVLFVIGFEIGFIMNYNSESTNLSVTTMQNTTMGFTGNDSNGNNIGDKVFI